jgi:gamma-glutamylcyclotransferase (GGCT)/AIG2-like uncharacterized protein YtfP
MDVSLFVYGSLRESGVQRAVFGRAVAGTPDTLVGFALSSLPAGHLIVDGTGDADDRVPGLRLSISRAELAAADGYEIEDYARIAARLESGAEAFVYARAGDAS